MKRSLLLLATCFVCTIASGQNTNDVLIISKSPQEAKVPFCDDDEKYPSFPGGMKLLYKYLGQHINYPKKAQTSKIEGKVIMQFIVEKSGQVSNINAASSPSIYLSNESVLVLKNIRFVPGTVDGNPARMSLILPVDFQLDNYKKHKSEKVRRGT